MAVPDNFSASQSDRISPCITVEPRGNCVGIDAQFTPPQAQLAYQPQLPGEADFQTVWQEPLPIVVEVLQSYTQWDQVLCHLPDLSPDL